MTRLTSEERAEIREAVLEALWANQPPVSMEDLEDHIPIAEKSRAISAFTVVRDELLVSHPLMAQPLKRMQIVVSDLTGAIATDGKKLYISASWWTSRPLAELRHTAAFLGLIITHDLMNRARDVPDLDAEWWQYACNLVLNRILVDQGVGVMPSAGVFMTKITSEDAVEDVYARLLPLTPEELIDAVFPTLGRRVHLTDLD